MECNLVQFISMQLSKHSIYHLRHDNLEFDMIIQLSSPGSDINFSSVKQACNKLQGYLCSCRSRLRFHLTRLRCRACFGVFDVTGIVWPSDGPSQQFAFVELWPHRTHNSRGWTVPTICFGEKSFFAVMRGGVKWWVFWRGRDGRGCNYHDVTSIF